MQLISTVKPIEKKGKQNDDEKEETTAGVEAFDMTSVHSRPSLITAVDASVTSSKKSWIKVGWAGWMVALVACLAIIGGWSVLRFSTAAIAEPPVLRSTSPKESRPGDSLKR